MSFQLTPELTATIQTFLVGGRYKDEEEVLREALAELRHRENVAAIQKGVEDMEAGRVRPWSEVKEELRAKLGMND
jgi:predicted transcriptional regulator